MAMTFLQQCARVRQECNGNGTGPTAVTNQVGELKRIVDWVATACEDVQRKHNEWKFMRGTFTLLTVASDDTYTYGDTVVPITLFRDWRKTTFKIYLTAAGIGSQTELPFIDYQDFLDLKIGNQNSSMPQCFSIGNAMEILLWPAPADVYTITGEYQKAVTTMAANADVPPYPDEYHMLAVYRAMMKYGRYTGAPEVYQEGKTEYNSMLKEMRRTQLPSTNYGHPLA
jgi:hypothetical protein